MVNTDAASSPLPACAERDFDAILPAGGRISGDFARIAGTEIKALIRLDGHTMLSRTINVLRRTRGSGRIVVVGPRETLDEAEECGADGKMLEGASGPENIFRGLAWLQKQDAPSPRILIAATDLPFISEDALNAYIQACPLDADLTLPILTREEFEGRFPGSCNEYVSLHEGRFTNGSVNLVDAASLASIRTNVEQIFESRKSQWRMARLVGWRVALGFAARRLSVPMLEKRVSEIVGLRAAAVFHAPAELAYDVDLPEEYAYARDMFDRQRMGAAI